LLSCETFFRIHDDKILKYIIGVQDSETRLLEFNNVGLVIVETLMKSGEKGRVRDVRMNIRGNQIHTSSG
jgi:hypothetical protein